MLTAGRSLKLSCTLQVVAVMAVGIYIHLGFASHHAYAFQVPITFGAMLSLLVMLICGVVCMQDK